MTKIVVLDGHTLNPGDISWAAFESLGELTVYERTPNELILERAVSAEVLLTNKTPLVGKMLRQLPKLKLVSCLATGFNIVDVESARGQGITVSNVPAYSTPSVAQHVFAMLLSFLHQPQNHHDAIQAGQWQAVGEFSFTLSPIRELAGKTMGIIGYGQIGDAVGRLASAFGMNVKAFRRTPTEPPTYRNFQWATREETIAESDVLSLHCPQTESSTGMVDREFLELMKPTSILINTARGGLVKEADLALALNEGTIAGACLDVVTTEPIDVGNPLLQAPRCLLTPHVAWNTVEARRRLMQVTAENIRSFLNGNPINVVN